MRYRKLSTGCLECKSLSSVVKSATPPQELLAEEVVSQEVPLDHAYEYEELEQRAYEVCVQLLHLLAIVLFPHPPHVLVVVQLALHLLVVHVYVPADVVAVDVLLWPAFATCLQLRRDEVAAQHELVVDVLLYVLVREEL